ncbi:MAG: hypothetical protein AUF65_01670 [Chloroflexi bacterium 13_1_20CM_50_12]|nr:MAG: hypothetical protein AUF65_01670 [Chloroflexi bacterium 13_1_20CM_50_12]
MFTFSPDGKSIYAFSPGQGLLKTLAVLLLTLLLTVAMAIVQLGAIAMAAFNFVMQAPGPSILRIALIIAGIFAIMAIRLAARGKSHER